jgi:uncharacterized protein
VDHHNNNHFAIEIKSGKTVNPDFFKNILYWQKVTENSRDQSFVVYGGTENQPWPQAQVLSWQSAGMLLKE